MSLHHTDSILHKVAVRYRLHNIWEDDPDKIDQYSEEGLRELLGTPTEDPLALTGDELYALKALADRRCYTLANFGRDRALLIPDNDLTWHDGLPSREDVFPRFEPFGEVPGRFAPRPEFAYTEGLPIAAFLMRPKDVSVDRIFQRYPEMVRRWKKKRVSSLKLRAEADRLRVQLEEVWTRLNEQPGGTPGPLEQIRTSLEVWLVEMALRGNDPESVTNCTHLATTLWNEACSGLRRYKGSAEIMSNNVTQCLLQTKTPSFLTKVTATGIICGLMSRDAILDEAAQVVAEWGVLEALLNDRLYQHVIDHGGPMEYQILNEPGWYSLAYPILEQLTRYRHPWVEAPLSYEECAEEIGKWLAANYPSFLISKDVDPSKFDVKQLGRIRAYAYHVLKEYVC